jgi:dihydroceramidase
VKLALLLVGLVAFGLLLLDFAAPSFAGYAPATCTPCYCELPRALGVAQRANTWSNLGFVFVGGLIVARGRDPLFGWATVFLGPASMALHATLTFAGQLVDILSMFLVPTLLLARNRGWSAAAYVALNGTLFVVEALLPQARRWIFAALVAAALWSELRVHRPRRLLAVAAGLLAAAFLAWSLDVTGVWCDPTSWVQGHALWHLVCAAAVGVLALYVEKPRITVP